MDTSDSTHRAERIRELFDAALEQDSATRGQYLDRACGDDVELRREVEALLQGASGADDVLQRLEKLDPHVAVRGVTLAEHDPFIGQQVSHYMIETKLGGGGMGVVYRARDTKLDRKVALKFLPVHLSWDAGAKKRFIREAKAASALDHVNIGYVHEINETDAGQLYIAMAYYEGETIKKKIARGPLPVSEALDYATQVAHGLSRVHAAGVIHRDIKPANVMVTTDGVAKVVDFGVAKMGDVTSTFAGTTLGTIAYMSPEQATGQKVDHRTDLWSLGVVLYEMLTARLPFRDSFEEVVHSILNDTPVPLRRVRPEVPSALAAIADKLLRKNHQERYARAEDVFADLRRLQIVEAAGEEDPLAVTAQPPEATDAVEVPADRKETEHSETTVASGDSSRRLPQVLRYGAVAAIVIALSIAGYLWSAGGRVPIDSVAVLPLANMTGNPDLEYAADGMTEALIGKLGQIKGLRRVISRTSVMRFKNTDTSLREIGSALDVAAVVEGSVRAYGAQTQIDVRLIDVETEERLWEQSFTRPADNVLALQNDVARSIAQAVAVRLTASDQARLAEDAAEVDPKVYDLYLKGLQARVSDTYTRYQVISGFEEAIALDSTFAPAYAALAIEYALVAGFAGDRAGIDKAERLAARALALEPQLSEPYVAIGLLRQIVDWDWNAAEQAFRQAIEVNPGDAFAHHELAQLWLRMGRFDGAIAMEKQALLLDPLSARYQSGIGEVYLFSRRYDDAIRELEKARALSPLSGPYYLGLAYWQKGHREKALEWWAKSNGQTITNLEMGRTRLDAVSGRRGAALAKVKQWEEAWADGELSSSPLWLIAEVYAHLGEYDKSLELLEQLYEARWGFLIYVKVWPTFYPLHKEPRFQSLLKKMRLE